jgi:hypothetical protein
MPKTAAMISGVRMAACAYWIRAMMSGWSSRDDVTRGVVRRSGHEVVHRELTTEGDLGCEEERSVGVRPEGLVHHLTLFVRDRHLERVLLGVERVQRHGEAGDLVGLGTGCPVVRGLGEPRLTAEDVVLAGLLRDRHDREQRLANQPIVGPAEGDVGQRKVDPNVA